MRLSRVLEVCQEEHYATTIANHELHIFEPPKEIALGDRVTYGGSALVGQMALQGKRLWLGTELTPELNYVLQQYQSTPVALRYNEIENEPE